MIALKLFIFKVLILAVNVYLGLIVIYVVSTFFVNDRDAPWFVFLEEMIEPPLRRIRRWTQGRTTVGNLDFAPVILVFSVLVIERLLIILGQ
ncbi:MAG: YggT family protein [Acidobacteria bacterium]|nr:YggT family protein [Acidobacteriota bacterium]